MSLILEALRKSEAERRRGQPPDLSAELPPPGLPHRGRVAPWAWLAAATALVFAAAWALLDRDRPAGSAIPVDTVTPPSQAPADTPANPAPVTGQGFPRVERIAPALPAAPAAKPAPGSAASPQPSTDAAAPASTPAPSPAEPPPRPLPSPGEARMTTFAELTAEERRQLPALRLSMHMWNEQPAQRFVILDGNRYVEGDRVGAALIQTIDTDGVVLELNGRMVRLPMR